MITCNRLKVTKPAVQGEEVVKAWSFPYIWDGRKETVAFVGWFV